MRHRTFAHLQHSLLAIYLRLVALGASYSVLLTHPIRFRSLSKLTMLNMLPAVEPCGVPIPPSPVIHPKLPRLNTLKTFGLPPQEVDNLISSAASADPSTPVSETLGGHSLRILIAPSGFKESLGPEHVADAIEAGIRKVVDGKAAVTRKLPLHDGGEGFCRALVAAHGGDMVEHVVTGPVGRPVQSHLGFIGDDGKTAVLDMAAAAGLRLVPKDMRDPTVTTTYGVGELMKKALDEGCTKIIIGCGDSGTSDGGAGMLQALGVRLLDLEGHEIAKADGGRSLLGLEKLDWSSIHPRLRNDASKPMPQFHEETTKLTRAQETVSRSKPCATSRTFSAAKQGSLACTDLRRAPPLSKWTFSLQR